MKRIFIVPLAIFLAVFCSCQKQQTEEERNAEIERRVEQRLASERQAQTEQELAERQAELKAREKALAEKQQVTAQAAATVSAETPLHAAKQPTASYSTFHNKLEPYGAWRETSNYGFVWQPYEAERSRSWRPYTNGRWVYTDAGWTWVSEEPFGWATYHYGRWTRLRNIGWVWLPGEEWAPAWVSWRKGNDYIGWAPLPPEARFDRRAGIQNWADSYYDIGPEQYCFVPTNEFGARRVETVLVPPTRNVTIVAQTTNVTNITYNNVTIVNQGPSYDEVRAHARQPVERLRLERQTSIDIETDTAKPVIRGEVIQMPAPVIAKGESIQRPRTVKETVAQPIAERGWEGITDQQAARKAREKIKSESTLQPTRPPFTRTAPETSASPSLSPGNSGSVSASPSFGRAAEGRELRRRQKELKKQQRATEEKLGPGHLGASPNESAAHTTPGSSSEALATSSPAEPTKTSEKTKHKRERPGDSEGIGIVSPSPSVAPR
jgi:Family of unknown function (DUF6600)